MQISNRGTQSKKTNDNSNNETIGWKVTNSSEPTVSALVQSTSSKITVRSMDDPLRNEDFHFFLFPLFVFQFLLFKLHQWSINWHWYRYHFKWSNIAHSMQFDVIKHLYPFLIRVNSLSFFFEKNLHLAFTDTLDQENNERFFLVKRDSFPSFQLE